MQFARTIIEYGTAGFIGIAVPPELWKKQIR